MTTTAVQFEEGVEPAGLTDRQALALLHRMLWSEGFDDRIAGHITARQSDGSLLCTPYGLRWDEVRASDIIRIDRDGRILEGRWPVTTAITLHLVVHKMRSDAVVAVHHHPEWATVWAATRKVPPIYDQLSAFVEDDLVIYDDYSGGVNEWDLAEANVKSMGGSGQALLANHGVLVVATSIAEAHLRCVSLEHRAKLAWRVESLGGGIPLRSEVAAKLARTMRDKGGWPQFFASMARAEMRRDPSVLD
ncbi:MAG: class aldolase/adducin family protein [Acidimicrobiales bacterium]|jgi:ribulose-5-phosphate 4-epimerase/fuculose-1-phosphate aldolase|nr:class aldolase/adducin family protein [Acidimicrobiales bacterium]